jgi:hypothetical protein
MWELFLRSDNSIATKVPLKELTHMFCFQYLISQTTSGYPWPSDTVRRKRDVPAPSERKERDDRARVPGPVSATAPETQGPCSGARAPVAKSLVYGPGPGSSWGDRASSPTRFNTYSRGSTHLGAARPGPGFFLSFASLKPGRWDLGPAGTLPCPARPCWPPS